MAETHDATPKGRRLVLCFDGTNNQFSGNETDTNIVKIYEMLDRESNDQYHYYQPGIGTYIPGKLENKAAGSIQMYRDSGFGTYFVNHVVAGYTFLLRYYMPDDKIYIFGFSRGAYTARFLSEMINSIGLLSMGNEEMITFAWDKFSDFQRSAADPDPDRKLYKEKQAYMEKFKSSFCRPGVKVHFLGLFDCVNSVLAFSSKLPMPHHVPDPELPAKYVRHAMSIHERRGTFQPVLFDPEPDPDPKPPAEPDSTTVDAKGRKYLLELWFSGNHGDVGGGWTCYTNNNKRYLLSDIPLAWMIEQVKEIDHDEDNRLKWNTQMPARSFRSGNSDAVRTHAQSQIDSWILDIDNSEEGKQKAIAIRAGVHDMLKWDTAGEGTFGSKLLWHCLWWITEGIGLPRWAQKKVHGDNLRHWRRTTKRNFGDPRPIPPNSKKHWSVDRLRACGAAGVSALEWMNNNDKNENFVAVDPKKELHQSFLDKDGETNGA